MSHDALATAYRNYIACLNARDWTNLGRFVAADVEHNGRTLGLSGYRAMLEQDFRDIPDLHFDIEALLVDAPNVACRLRFNCTPSSGFLGLPAVGRKVSFTEHVFYAFEQLRIVRVWSIIDKLAIEKQLGMHDRG